MTRLLHLGAIVAMFVALLALAGCSGGGSTDGGINPPPTTDTGTISGRVAHADNVNIGMSGAIVSVVGTAGDTLATGTAGTSGSFLLQNVPVGVWTLRVETPNESDYGSQSVPNVRVIADGNTEVVVTVLRAIDPAPTAIYLAPSTATVDIGGMADFSARVVGPAGDLPATPVFMVSSSIGDIDSNGVFRGLRVGTGSVIAICGDVTATAQVTVQAARPPEITSFLVAPLSIAASGGRIYVTASANDGDGIVSVQAEILKPDASTEFHNLTFNTASTDTYQLFTQTEAGPELGYRIPWNTNEPDRTGYQAPQTYSIRLIVTDGSGATSTTPFTNVTVAGLDTPPPTGQ